MTKVKTKTRPRLELPLPPGTSAEVVPFSGAPVPQPELWGFVRNLQQAMATYYGLFTELYRDNLLYARAQKGFNRLEKWWAWLRGVGSLARAAELVRQRAMHTADVLVWVEYYRLQVAAGLAWLRGTNPGWVLEHLIRVEETALRHRLTLPQAELALKPDYRAETQRGYELWLNSDEFTRLFIEQQRQRLSRQAPVTRSPQWEQWQPRALPESLPLAVADWLGSPEAQPHLQRFAEQYVEEDLQVAREARQEARAQAQAQRRREEQRRRLDAETEQLAQAKKRLAEDPYLSDEDRAEAAGRYEDLYDEADEADEDEE